MQFYFYDTSSLLKELHNAFNDKKFYISNLTLKELEDIKTSKNKNEDIRYKARKLIHLLEENEDKYEIINYQKEWDKELVGVLLDNIDSRIILCAKHCPKIKSLLFITEDLCCRQIAKSVGLNTKYLKTIEENDYTGYKDIIMTEEEQGEFYISLKNFDNSKYNLLHNEYLLIRDTNGKILDRYKYQQEQGLIRVNFPVFNNKLLGKIKPKDEYQQIVMDSLCNNTITMMRGPAGTGKSFLAMGYLLDRLECGYIDKIIIFCNTVATAGSAQLGYYPGSRNEKLLDSQIGNFLVSKLGGRMIVDRMISEEKLILLPMSDIRGYDTTGMKAGVYITEAQNLDIELMRLALQRIGEDSICILDGDSESQVDLPQYAGSANGLRRTSLVFRGQDFYGEVTLQNIYRSKIAQIAQLM